jgi:hypothetical protein
MRIRTTVHFTQAARKGGVREGRQLPDLERVFFESASNLNNDEKVGDMFSVYTNCKVKQRFKDKQRCHILQSHEHGDHQQ